MRNLTHHHVNEMNEALTIEVVDEPGSGGACHRYEVSGMEHIKNPSSTRGVPAKLTVLFQNGPILEHGVNGVTHEVLLAILQDRLEGFQSGAYANQYNDLALQHIIAAQSVLQLRTKERLERGVEGTHTI